MKKGSYILILPVGIFSVLLLYLVVWNTVTSFENWSLFNSHPTFVGIATYTALFKSFEFSNSLIHSLELSGALVAVGNLLGILIASLLYFLSSNTSRSIFLSIVIYPLAISMAVNGLIWLWLFNIHIGIDWLFTKIGLPSFPWLSTPSTIFPSLILVTIWSYTGLAVIFYLAGFMNIDKTIIEAARIDGTNAFKILYKILLPNSFNSFVIATALLFLFSFRIFSLPYVLGGGPSNVFLQTSVMYMFFLFTTEFFSRATAVSTIVTVIAAVVIIPYALIVIRKWVRR